MAEDLNLIIEVSTYVQYKVEQFFRTNFDIKMHNDDEPQLVGYMVPTMLGIMYLLIRSPLT